MAPDVLVVMARYPTPGAVKTRLAPVLGSDGACALYRAFLADIAAAWRAPGWRLVWAVTPAGADLRAVVGAGAEQIAQRGDTLAARMRHVFEDLFAAGAARVVMCGADVPHLGVDRLAAAFAALSRHDVVLAPTRDGGYCLIGLRAAHDVFTGIAMGGVTVCADTLARAAALGLSTTCQAPTFDVDEPDDVDALAALLATGDAALPATAAALHRLPARDAHRR